MPPARSCASSTPSTSTTTCRRSTPTSTSPTRSSRRSTPDPAGDGSGWQAVGMALGVGDAAPDFSLDGTGQSPGVGRRYTLSEHRGQPVVLVFYPGDDTPVCTAQLTRYTK